MGVMQLDTERLDVLPFIQLQPNHRRRPMDHIFAPNEKHVALNARVQEAQRRRNS
jgi:hypothetical protein